MDRGVRRLGSNCVKDSLYWLVAWGSIGKLHQVGWLRGLLLCVFRNKHLAQSRPRRFQKSIGAEARSVICHRSGCKQVKFLARPGAGDIEQPLSLLSLAV